MDTDSNYMALAGELLNCIKPNMLATFPDEYERWMVIPYCDQHKQAFWTVAQKGGDVDTVTSQPCCQMRFKHDSRTPGKFKQEFKGTAIVALNSKTYICSSAPVEGQHNGRTKLSSKGLSKRTNNLTLNHYKKVLRSRRHLNGVNTGFVRKRNNTVTYSQIKRGLSYFYGKRLVCSDGVTTRPLRV